MADGSTYIWLICMNGCYIFCGVVVVDAAILVLTHEGILVSSPMCSVFSTLNDIVLHLTAMTLQDTSLSPISESLWISSMAMCMCVHVCVFVYVLILNVSHMLSGVLVTVTLLLMHMLRNTTASIISGNQQTSLGGGGGRGIPCSALLASLYLDMNFVVRTTLNY